MSENLSFDWADMPPQVRAWYLEQLEKQEAAQRQAVQVEQDRGNWVLKRNALSPEPLTRPDGSVLYKDPVVYDEQEPKSVTANRTGFLKRQLGLE